ncbi:MAG: hypothetical protein GOVbin556_87 [Prokaryotic dsDNA virus sp.]|nr:MAG: hypothetical protein GOVbin556_87 [Prokaryotic dsDNA virus sp.]|tara:strand:- start:1949 stop:2692 length:744 start_codon:yes stop_codon:yes gene_type:complete
MGLFGTSNGALATQMQNNNQSNFKAMNNLLTLQDNHVEEFLLYHGEAFLTTFEKLLEDVVQRVVSAMLADLHFKLEPTQGDITLEKTCLTKYQQITEENIELDIQKILTASVNSEVVYQRQMAKSQYLEAQGFGDGANPQMAGAAAAAGGAMVGGAAMGMQGAGVGPNGMPIQGAPPQGGMNQQMMNQQQAFNNQSGYPVPPAGYDNYNNPYWIDPATGQATYSPPNSGLGLSKMISKGAAWAKWLA